MTPNPQNITCRGCGGTIFINDESRTNAAQKIKRLTPGNDFKLDEMTEYQITQPRFVKCKACNFPFADPVITSPTISITLTIKDIGLKPLKILKYGIDRCPEVLELQRILQVPEDGFFGLVTLKKLRSKFKTNKISLTKLQVHGIKVRKSIPIKEIYWLNESKTYSSRASWPPDSEMPY